MGFEIVLYWMNDFKDFIQQLLAGEVPYPVHLPAIGGSLLLLLASLNRKHYEPLIDWISRAENHIDSEPYDDPLTPIMSVNDDILTIKDVYRHQIRIFVLFPILALVWGFGLYRIVDFGPSYFLIHAANTTLEKLEKGITPDKSRYLSLMSYSSINPRYLSYEAYTYSRKQRGEDIDSLLKEDQRTIDFYRVLLSHNGTSSPFRYIKAVNTYGTEFEKEQLKETMKLNFIYLLFALIVSAAIIAIPRGAYLHFDRKRGIVYTWRFGKISACSFDSLGYRYINFHGGFVCLLGEKGFGFKTFKPRAFRLEATSAKRTNSEKGDQNFLLAQIADFMKYGKEAIITSEKFERKEPKSYFFVSKKPKLFEERLEKILSKEHDLPSIYRKKKL